MNKIIALIVIAGLLTGCATFKNGVMLDVDQTAQSFFDHLQKSDYPGAYALLGKGISQRISFDQFDQFMRSMREHWGRIVSDETALMPFHKRQGESNFIPLHVTPEQIKRYIFNVKFDSAEMNFDLTLAPEGGGYKIVWFSVWGSSVYLTGPMREKIEGLFSNPNDSPQ